MLLPLVSLMNKTACRVALYALGAGHGLPTLSYSYSTLNKSTLNKSQYRKIVVVLQKTELEIWGRA